MKKKSILQKSSFYFAVFSVLASIASVVYLYLNIGELSWKSPVSASLLASTFFFGFIAFIFFIIGSANIPSFKVSPNEDT